MVAKCCTFDGYFQYDIYSRMLVTRLLFIGSEYSKYILIITATENYKMLNYYKFVNLYITVNMNSHKTKQKEYRKKNDIRVVRDNQ